MDVERWKSQLWQGAAELAVLALRERRESYGLELLEAVRGREGRASRAAMKAEWIGFRAA